MKILRIHLTPVWSVWPILIALLVPASSHAAAPAALAPLDFLLGEWTAIASGRPGEPSGGFTFSLGLQDHVLLRTNYSVSPGDSVRPATRHDDLMVIHPSLASPLAADYYDSEGHVIRYTVQSPAAGQVVFLSDAAAAGPRFRLSYLLKPDGTLQGAFEIAPPGQPEAFQPYLSWMARKVGSAH